jgi:hypothetical protein
MKFHAKEIVFAAILLLLFVLGFEVVLNLLAAASPRIDSLLTPPWDPYRVAATVPDERLGHRLNPEYPGHDSKGFCNPAVPDRAEIVVFGDSQTYPTNIGSEQAWPRRLESLTRKTVYSLAVPGYGPVHSLILWPEAVALHPAIVVEAFYAGNDLYDSFDVVYNRGQLAELKTADPHRQEVVQEAEELEPIAERVATMFLMGGERADTPSKKEPAAAPRLPSSALGFLSQHSKIYGLLRRIRYEVPRLLPNRRWEKAKKFAHAHADYCQIFSAGQFKTVFTSEYRLSALNLEDPRIAEGEQISLRALQRLNELAVASSIRFVVALIPTKELVFKEMWASPAESFRTVTEYESQFWNTVKQFLDENGIEYVDLHPTLRGLLASGIQPYPVSHDGHPNAQAHAAIANRIHAQLEREERTE